jgi:hypothetical protein
LLPVEQDDVALVVVDDADDTELVTAECDEIGMQASLKCRRECRLLQSAPQST